MIRFHPSVFWRLLFGGFCFGVLVWLNRLNFAGQVGTGQKRSGQEWSEQDSQVTARPRSKVFLLGKNISWTNSLSKILLTNSFLNCLNPSNFKLPNNWKKQISPEMIFRQFLSKPQINHNSTQPNKTKVGFDIITPPPPPPLTTGNSTSALSQLFLT